MYLLVILFFVLSIVVPALFRLLKGGRPRNKVRTILEYTRKRGYSLVNPSVAQAVDSSMLEILRNPALKSLVKASSDISDVDGLENDTGDWLAFTCNLHSKEVTIFNYSESSPRPDSSDRNICYKVAKIKAGGTAPVFGGEKVCCACGGRFCRQGSEPALSRKSTSTPANVRILRHITG